MEKCYKTIWLCFIALQIHDTCTLLENVGSENPELQKILKSSNPEFFGDLVYKFKKIIGNPNFSNLFKRIVNRFKRAGYSLGIMRLTACLVFNPIMIEGYAALFSCTAVVQASDSLMAASK